MNQWLWASTLLVALELPLLCFGALASRLDAFVALQAAGGIATMALITLAEGFHRPTWNAAFDAVALYVLNAILTHSLARVLRQRAQGDVEL